MISPRKSAMRAASRPLADARDVGAQPGRLLAQPDRPRAARPPGARADATMHERGARAHRVRASHEDTRRLPARAPSRRARGAAATCPDPRVRSPEPPARRGSSTHSRSVASSRRELPVAPHARRGLAEQRARRLAVRPPADQRAHRVAVRGSSKRALEQPGGHFVDHGCPATRRRHEQRRGPVDDRARAPAARSSARGPWRARCTPVGSAAQSRARTLPPRAACSLGVSAAASVTSSDPSARRARSPPWRRHDRRSAQRPRVRHARRASRRRAAAPPPRGPRSRPSAGRRSAAGDRAEGLERAEHGRAVGRALGPVLREHAGHERRRAPPEARAAASPHPRRLLAQDLRQHGHDVRRPENAGSPVRHSKSTHPRAKTSARASSARSPVACSGAMYPDVPMTTPVAVIGRACAPARERGAGTIPKSRSFARAGIAADEEACCSA